ncbi:hypothetical protein HMPREF9306_01372 [Propionimicrobium lymphophilum ACS-093-V-SCH5]|uniref:Uncharacterized protein n=2 Tax=Propionimicrobium TaxID=203133 RepID=S2VYS5_9ACTN|nr:hypothetical protein HMPREF9306_01372 [Propionimicrobium lymphophilum ACS-093-V-SCH5]
MLRDKNFLSKVAEMAGADSSEVTEDDSEVTLRAGIAAPSKAQKFVGQSINLKMVATWSDLIDGRAEADLSSTVENMPATLTGKALLRGNEKLTVVDYECDFTVSVPLLSKKIEETASPYVMRVIDKQQEVGKEWLS